MLIPIWEAWKKGKINVCKCLKCGVICLNPRKKEKYYKQYYSNRYWKDFSSSDFSQAEKVFTHLERHLTKESKILDIGCGKGYSLVVLKRKGFDNLTGVEPSPKWCRNLQDKYKIKCFNQSFSEFETREKFDCIILSGVLEHLAEPQKALVKIRELLKDSGICYIRVPNRDETEDFYSQFSFPHCFYFDKSSLELLLKNQGLKIIKYYKNYLMVSDEFTLLCSK